VSFVTPAGPPFQRIGRPVRGSATCPRELRANTLLATNKSQQSEAGSKYAEQDDPP
jgi:hypothetical protein